MDKVEQDKSTVERSSSTRLKWRWFVVVLIVAGLLSGIVAKDVGGVGNPFDQAARTLGLSWPAGDDDSDGDGLPDHVEEEGWGTATFGRFVTNPREADSDADGLTDGQEAGAGVGDEESSARYAGLTDPLRFDTDGDGVGDGDEYFLDMDPRLVDTDGDGLDDEAELDFGSDPTLDNPDKDSFSDKEEQKRGSDPLAYDLRKIEALAAFGVGAAAGDWSWGAKRLGRMSDAQLESAEYLAGSIASGYVGVGDLRDMVVALGDLDLLSAVSDLMSVAPGAGDGAKTVEKLMAFARQSDRARRSAESVLRRLPIPARVKDRAKRALTGGKVALPSRFDVGPSNNVVYRGVGYVGITNDFVLRKAQHASAGRSFIPEKIAGADGLKRFEARAIEEACIVELGLAGDGGALQNQRHSISPNDPDYDSAVAWGRNFLKRANATCS